MQFPTELTAAINTTGTARSGRVRVLSLDGGGAKGVYTLGVLTELEAKVGRPLCEVFDLIYGTSTGSIIAAMLALSYRAGEIFQLYSKLIPTIMGSVLRLPSRRSSALKREADRIFGDRTPSDFLTGIGIVTTNWHDERPTIIKTHLRQAHGRHETFTPGFGCKISDAVLASCAAFPFFSKVKLTTSNQGEMLLWDGGFCANNPTLFAIADARAVVAYEHRRISVVSVGCGSYPERTDFSRQVLSFLKPRHFLKVLNTGSTTIEQVRRILFPDIQCVRISDAYTCKNRATDLLETRQDRLDDMYRLGCESFRSREQELEILLKDDTLRKATR